MQVIHRRNPDATVHARHDAGRATAGFDFQACARLLETAHLPYSATVKNDGYREMETPTDQHYQSITGLRCAWYCIRSKPKHEHIASKNLRRLRRVEVFNPRFRLRKITRRGPAWVIESLFPNYLFVHFPFNQMLDEVRFTPGVSSLVGFGMQYPEVPAKAIDELRESFPADDLQVVDGLPQRGDAVTITTRPMFGLSGVVLRSMPARQRVQVLLDMLGQVATVELNVKDMVTQRRNLPTGLIAQRRAA